MNPSTPISARSTPAAAKITAKLSGARAFTGSARRAVVFLAFLGREDDRLATIKLRLSAAFNARFWRNAMIDYMLTLCQGSSLLDVRRAPVAVELHFRYKGIYTPFRRDTRNEEPLS